MARHDIAISGGPDRWSRRDTIRARAKRNLTAIEIVAPPRHCPTDVRVCMNCGAPAEMSASLGPACPDCYDALSD